MDSNPIYKFMKENNLTQMDEASFSKAYSDPQKSAQIHKFMVDNKLTNLDAGAFHSAYFDPSKKKEPTTKDSGQPTKPSAPSFGQKVMTETLVSGAPVMKGVKKEPQKKQQDITFRREEMPSETTQAQIPQPIKTVKEVEKKAEQGKFIQSPVASVSKEKGTDFSSEATIKKVNQTAFEKSQKALEDKGVNILSKEDIDKKISNEYEAQFGEEIESYMTNAGNKSDKFFPYFTVAPTDLTDLQIALGEREVPNGTTIEKEGKRGEMVSALMDDYFDYMKKTRPEVAEAEFNKYSTLKPSADRSAKNEEWLHSMETRAIQLKMAAVKRNFEKQKSGINEYSKVEASIDSRLFDSGVIALNQERSAIDSEYKRLEQKAKESFSAWGERDEAYSKAIQDINAKSSTMKREDYEAEFNRINQEYQKEYNAYKANYPDFSKLQERGDKLQSDYEDLKVRSRMTDENVASLEQAKTAYNSLGQSALSMKVLGTLNRDNLNYYSEYKTLKDSIEKAEEAGKQRWDNASPLMKMIYAPGELANTFSAGIGNMAINALEIPKIVEDLVTGNTKYNFLDEIYDGLENYRMEKRVDFPTIESDSSLQYLTSLGGNALSSLATFALGGTFGGASKMGQFGATFATSWLVTEADAYEEAINTHKMSSRQAAAASTATAIAVSLAEGLIPDVKYFEPSAFRKSILNDLANGKSLSQAFSDSFAESSASYLKSGLKEMGEEVTQQKVDNATKEIINYLGETEYFKDLNSSRRYKDAAFSGLIGGKAGNFFRRPVGASNFSEEVMLEAAENADGIIAASTNSADVAKVKQDLKGPREDFQALSAHPNWKNLPRPKQARVFGITQQMRTLEDGGLKDPVTNAQIERLKNEREELLMLGENGIDAKAVGTSTTPQRVKVGGEYASFFINEDGDYEIEYNNGRSVIVEKGEGVAEKIREMGLETDEGIIGEMNIENQNTLITPTLEKGATINYAGKNATLNNYAEKNGKVVSVNITTEDGRNLQIREGQQGNSKQLLENLNALKYDQENQIRISSEVGEGKKPVEALSAETPKAGSVGVAGDVEGVAYTAEVGGAKSKGIYLADESVAKSYGEDGKPIVKYKYKLKKPLVIEKDSDFDIVNKLMDDYRKENPNAKFHPDITDHVNKELEKLGYDGLIIKKEALDTEKGYNEIGGTYGEPQIVVFDRKNISVEQSLKKTPKAQEEVVPEITQEEVEANMKPITDEMANVEMEFGNNGFSIDWDYDDEIIITDNKTGEIIDAEELPESLLPLAAQYEKATTGLAGYDFKSYQKSLDQSRKDIGGIETEFEEVKPATLPEKTETAKPSRKERLAGLFEEEEKPAEKPIEETKPAAPQEQPTRKGKIASLFDQEEAPKTVVQAPKVEPEEKSDSAQLTLKDGRKISPTKINGQTTFFHASSKKREGRLKANTAPQWGNAVYFAGNRKGATDEFGGDNVTEASLDLKKPLYTNSKEFRTVREKAAELYNKAMLPKIRQSEAEFVNGKWKFFNEDFQAQYDNKGYVDFYSSSDIEEGKYFGEAARELGYDAIIDEGGQYGTEIAVLDENAVIYPEDVETSLKTPKEVSDENVISVTNYDEKAKKLAHAVKNGDADAIDIMAKEMAVKVPENAVLIPMPSRSGKATNMKDLAEVISKISGAPVADVLTGKKRESLYEAKKKGETISADDLKMQLNGELPKGKIPIIIDNVLATGATFKAAKEAIPNAKIIVHSVDQVEAKKAIGQSVNELINKKNRYNKIPKRRKAMGTNLLNQIKQEAENLGFNIVNVKGGNISLTSKDSGKVVARRDVDRKFNQERNNKLKEAKSMAQDSLLGLRASVLLYFMQGGKVMTSQSELAGKSEIAAAKKVGFISDNGRSVDMIALEDLQDLGGVVFDEQDAVNEILDVLATFENKAQMEDELIEMRDKLTNDMDEAAKYEYESQMRSAIRNDELVGLDEDELVEYYESLSEDEKVKTIEDYEKFYQEVEREQPEQGGQGGVGIGPSKGTTQEAQEQKITYGPNEGLTRTDTAAGPFVSESGNAPYSEPSGVRGQGLREGGVGSTIKAVWNKYKQIKFNGSVKVKDAEDVAHIMRKLEDKSVEHAFAVHVDKNGKTHIQFLGMGGPTSTIVDPRLVLAGVKKFKSKKVYLVHNHPSGSLVASRADVKLTNNVNNFLSPLGIEVEHVIMDTYKKQYVHLYPDDVFFVKDRNITKESIEEYNKALKVEIMDEQKILSDPMGSIKDSTSVSQFLMQLRFTALPKHGMLLLNNKNEIIGNYIFKKGFDYNEATSFIAGSGVGTGVIFYSNQDQFSSGVKPMIDSLGSAEIKVFDYVIVDSDSEGVKGYYQSYADENKLQETQSKYGTNSIPNELREPTPRTNAEVQGLMEDAADAVEAAINSGTEAQKAVNDIVGSEDWYAELNPKLKQQFNEILQDEFGVTPKAQPKAKAPAAKPAAKIGTDIQSIVDNYYKLKDGDRAARTAINEILDVDPKLKYIYDNISKINKQLQEAGVITNKTDGCP
jgi:DNA repair protein RadC/predicted amidophosphoribosyltransferase